METAALRSFSKGGLRQLSSLSDAQAFIDALARASVSAQLALMLEQISGDMGFDHYALVHHVDHRMSEGGGILRLENYPSAWVDIFLEKALYSWDPVHVASYTTNAAFAWSDVPHMIRLNNRQAQVLKAAAIEGLGDGFTVPAHVPGQISGSCSFAVRTGRDLPRDRLAMVQLVGAFAFQAARALAAAEMPSPRPDARVALTPRQLDCILWAGRGKSDWEIAQILGINEETVTDHLRSARTRYGVGRRIQLVMHAVRDGHIALSDLAG